MTGIDPPAPSLNGISVDNAAGAIRGESLVGADQETALMTVQTERTRLLDKEIATQIEELREVNRKLEQLNELQAGLQTMQARFKSDAKYSARVGERFDPDLVDHINRSAMEAGVNLGFDSRRTDRSFFANLPDAKQWLIENRYETERGNRIDGEDDAYFFLEQDSIQWWAQQARLDREASDLGSGGYLHPEEPGQPPNRCPGGLRHDSTFAELKKAVNKIKGLVDNLSNVQQDQMLRLQSLMNKRNESAEIMSNHVRKMQESRSTIAEKIRGE